MFVYITAWFGCVVGPWHVLKQPDYFKVVYGGFNSEFRFFLR